jgi:hypothetical protein
VDIPVIIAFVVSIGIVVGVLLRQRSRLEIDEQGSDDHPQATPRPTRRTTKQERMLQKLSPLPEIPTIMDLMREEMAETGVETIPGHEGLTGPVMLKVFRRDALIRERCTHDGIGFVTRDDVEPEEATENDVVLFCTQCGPIQEEDESGTDSEEEAL